MSDPTSVREVFLLEANTVETPCTFKIRPKQKNKEEPEQPKLRMVWVVLNQELREFDRFPYSEKDRAEAVAELRQRHSKNGDTYFVQPRKESM